MSTSPPPLLRKHYCKHHLSSVSSARRHQRQLLSKQGLSNSYITGARDVWDLLHRSPRARSDPKVRVQWIPYILSARDITITLVISLQLHRKRPEGSSAINPRHPKCTWYNYYFFWRERRDRLILLDTIVQSHSQCQTWTSIDPRIALWLRGVVNFACVTRARSIDHRLQANSQRWSSCSLSYRQGYLLQLLRGKLPWYYILSSYLHRLHD